MADTPLATTTAAEAAEGTATITAEEGATATTTAPEAGAATAAGEDTGEAAVGTGGGTGPARRGRGGGARPLPATATTTAHRPRPAAEATTGTEKPSTPPSLSTLHQNGTKASPLLLIRPQLWLGNAPAGSSSLLRCGRGRDGFREAVERRRQRRDPRGRLDRLFPCARGSRREELLESVDDAGLEGWHQRVVLERGLSPMTE